PVPFGDLAWDHISQQLPKATEEELAEAVAALLTRAHAGPVPATKGSKKDKPSKNDHRIAARTRATAPTAPPPQPEPPEELASEGPAEGEKTLAEVIPLGLFDPLEDP
ncbi:integrase, partial [Streptomyces goshikiensis]